MSILAPLTHEQREQAKARFDRQIDRSGGPAACLAVDRRQPQPGLRRANGHDVAQVGATPTGKCRQCARDRNAQYKAKVAARQPA